MKQISAALACALTLLVLTGCTANEPAEPESVLTPPTSQPRDDVSEGPVDVEIVDLTPVEQLEAELPEDAQVIDRFDGSGSMDSFRAFDHDGSYGYVVACASRGKVTIEVHGEESTKVTCGDLVRRSGIRDKPGSLRWRVVAADDQQWAVAWIDRDFS